MSTKLASSAVTSLQKGRYRDRLGDTFLRNDVYSRLWRFARKSSKILDIRAANGNVVSDTRANVYIQELGAYLWSHLVKDSPSVLSLGKTMQ